MHELDALSAGHCWFSATHRRQSTSNNNRRGILGHHNRIFLGPPPGSRSQSKAVSGQPSTHGSLHPSLPFPNPHVLLKSPPPVGTIPSIRFSLSPLTLGSEAWLQMWNPSTTMASTMQSHAHATALVKMGVAVQSPPARFPCAPGPSRHPFLPGASAHAYSQECEDNTAGQCQRERQNPGFLRAARSFYQSHQNSLPSPHHPASLPMSAGISPVVSRP